jgi:Zn-dependent peptidase ImmA (M78 family)
VRSSDPTPWREPVALGFSRGDVSSLATRIADQVGYEPGAPLEPIVHRLGGQIVFGEDPDTYDSGSIEIRDNRFTIFIPLDTPPLRDRFTIAHELGHFVLHYLFPNQHENAGIRFMRAQRYGTGPVEYEANWFAAAFLMPAKKYRHSFEDLDGNLLLLANHFQVSTQAATVRAKSLGLTV